jgi:phospholipid transport system substrate-binding protein
MKFFATAILTMILASGIHAEEMQSPDTLIRNVTQEVLEIVRSDKDIQSGNSRKTTDLINSKVLPHFNFVHMTALAVAREWRQATPEQQKTLTDEFRSLLVRTYSKALTEYRNQTIDYKPFKMKPEDTDVRVRTQVLQSGSKPIPLDYFLEKLADGWKVYDIEVAGVSLVTSYRGEFANEIRNGGIDGLIKTIQTKNRGSSDKTASTQK